MAVGAIQVDDDRTITYCFMTVGNCLLLKSVAHLRTNKMNIKGQMNK